MATGVLLADGVAPMAQVIEIGDGGAVTTYVWPNGVHLGRRGPDRDSGARALARRSGFARQRSTPAPPSAKPPTARP